jgi:ABC-type transporter Mla subunit MlaD
MPRFRDSENPSLNPLMEIKKAVHQRNIQKFRGDENTSSVPRTTEGSPDAFEALYKIMTSVNAYFGEVTNVLDTYSKSAKTTGAEALADRFTGTATTLSQLFKQANMLLKKMNYSLDGFSSNQIKAIEKEFDEMVAYKDNFDENFEALSDLADGVPSEQEIYNDIVAAEVEREAERVVGERTGTPLTARERADFNTQVTNARQRAQLTRHRKNRFEALFKLFKSWYPSFATFAKYLAAALRATPEGLAPDVSSQSYAFSQVGSGYGGLLPSHMIQTSNYLPRRFI